MEPTFLPHHHHHSISRLQATTTPSTCIPPISNTTKTQLTMLLHQLRPRVSMATHTQRRRRSATTVAAAPASPSPLDLTEDNVARVLADARVELAQIFDTSVGITGEVGLAELDGPFVKITLKGKFWHKRSTVLARVANYLKQRIPEILEVEIEDEKQLDDSPANF